jgi:hypothetical protein
MRALLGLGIVGLGLAACGGTGETYVVVTVDSRPAVQNAASLRVTLTNGGATLTNALPLGSHTFPVTFSVSSPSATGDLTIDIAALDAGSDVVGEGTLTTPLAAGSASVTLDPADFVVNTEYPMDQLLTSDFRAVGTQLAAMPDGTWTVGFHDNCGVTGISTCYLYARMFDGNGAPIATQIGAGTNQFDVNTTATTFYSEPTAAAGSDKTLVLWDSHDESQTPTVDGIGCRPLDAQGNSPDIESDFALESSTEVVSAAALESGNFAVVWDSDAGSGGAEVVRSQLVGPDCSPIGSPVTLSQGSADDLPSRAHVAANGASVLYAWIVNDDLHVRAASTGNVLSTADITLVPHTATASMQHVRIVPAGSGFAMLVRTYSDTDQTAPGTIELYLVSSTGTVMGQPTLVTDKAGSDFDSAYSFGAAVGADGTILVVWHACAENGDGQGCGVFGRMFSPAGAALADAFVVPTTTLADQTNPAAIALTGGAFAVAWNDMSMTAPDIQGLAVRARIVYPPGQ